MKKIISLVLSMVMVLSLTVLSFADTEKFSIKIQNDSDGHTYEAYQIFSGSLSNNGVLSNIEWGSSVTKNGQDKMGSASAKAETLKEEDHAKEFAKYLFENKFISNPVATVSQRTDGKYVMNGLAPGYYIIKDKDNTLTNKDDAYTSYIVQVVGNVDMSPKNDKPKVEKKVKDTNDTDGTTSDWQDSADYDIGDKVPFKLTATLPNNVSSYDKYYVKFNDTLSKGLTYDGDSTVTIKIGNKDVTENFTINSTKDNEGNTKLTFSCDDIIALGATNNSKITVEYTATLNDKAVIGSAGNPNKVNLEYSNNPNQSGGGEHGKTPEDTVIVFTYKTIINKVDGKGDPLKGAEFKLEKNVNGEWKEVKGEISAEGTKFTFKGLDEGKYRLTETKTPEGYNSINPIEFTITASHDIESENPELKELNGNITTGEIKFESNKSDGSLSTNIVNKAGATLPITGGIGTKIFYVLGSVLVIVAGVLFVTKRRMSTR